MKLDPLHGPSPVPEPHDLPFLRLRADLQAVREGFPLHDERVVAPGGKGAGEPLEDRPPVVEDRGGLAVHDPPRPDDPAAEGVADRLVAQADPHDGDPRVERPDRRRTVIPACSGEQGPGERKIASGFIASISIQGDLVVPADGHLLPKLAQVLDQVVGKGIVVVDHQYHGFSPFL